MTLSAQDAALELVDGRIRALRSERARLNSRYEFVGESELLKEIADVTRQDRPVFGLLLAERVLQRALVNGAKSAMGEFVFRFGAHLKASVGLRSLGNDDRVVLATAARDVFRASPRMSRQLDEAETIIDRLPTAGDSESAWRRQFGMSAEDFEARVDLLAGTLRPAEKPRFDPQTPATRPHRAAHPNSVVVGLPSWLSLPTSPAPTSTTFTEGARTWPALDAQRDAPLDLAAGWTLFVEGDYEGAREALWDVFASVGQAWAPSPTPDGARTWNWLRLVWLLADEASAQLSDRRRALLSALELARRSVPSDVALSDWLAEDALRDYVAATAHSQSDWAVHAARAIFTYGNDVLDVYDNAIKADLRLAWSTQFGPVVEGTRQTHQMVEALQSEFKYRLQDLLRATSAEPLVPRRVVAPLRGIEQFLDAEERRIASAAAELANAVAIYLSQEESLASDSLATIAEIESLQSAIAASESVLLQDTLGTAFAALREACRTRHEELSSGSRPNVAAELVATRLPLSSQVHEPFAFELALRNIGNAAAELVEATLTSLAIELLDPVRVVERIAPGAERVVHFRAMSLGDAPIAPITCDLEWQDSLEQSFRATFELRAEDQRPASWSADDINPFKLGTISSPKRLVGRDEDLDVLERITSGGGSAAITGLKRVGKTSLAKTFLTRMKADGWATEYLPLGQVLTGDPSAVELVSALIETVYDAVITKDDDILIPEPPVSLESANFARASGRWIRQAGAVLSDMDVHVLIALDDFDELPQTLYEGAEADALFLFLRSIIDESWLSLMFIGSEVLPTIIRAQAHKLNQVTPYVVSNFQSAAATEELLGAATKPWCEWQEGAYNRAHFVCGGNPYYLTLLGQDIWQRMRELDRSFVSGGDVDEAVLRVAATAPATHFMHLWADSSVGLDSRSRQSLQASAVLRAVAIASGPKFVFAARKEAIDAAHGWLPGSSNAEINAGAGSLVARGVLITNDQTLRVAVPLASAWLCDAGGRELEQQFAADEQESARKQAYSSLDLLQLTKSVNFCGDSVSEIKLQGWLEQFPAEVRYVAYLLASRLLTEGFFSSTRLTQEVMPALKVAIQATAAWAVRTPDAGGYAKNVYVLQHGVGGSSSHAVATTLTKLLRIKKTNVVDPPNFVRATKGLKAPSVVIVADDLAGTGNQLRTETQRLLSHLEGLKGPWREQLNVVVAAGVSATPVLWQEPQDDIHVECVTGLELGPRVRAFSPDAGIFANDDDLHSAADSMDAIGQSLSPASPRGFGDLGLLIATEQNCPNNTLPIFWKAGKHLGQDWMPLLERRL